MKVVSLSAESEETIVMRYRSAEQSQQQWSEEDDRSLIHFATQLILLSHIASNMMVSYEYDGEL